MQITSNYSLFQTLLYSTQHYCILTEYTALLVCLLLLIIRGSLVIIGAC